MALTPEQALEFRPMTLPQQHAANKIEKEIDERIKSGWKGLIIVHDVPENHDAVILFEVARRFRVAGWLVEVQFAQSTVGPKGTIAPGVSFKLQPVWKRI